MVHTTQIPPEPFFRGNEKQQCSLQDPIQKVKGGPQLIETKTTTNQQQQPPHVTVDSNNSTTTEVSALLNDINIAFDNITQIGGRLKMFENAWQDLTTDKIILKTVAGYELEFVDGFPPKQSMVPAPYKLTAEEKEAVDTEINRLLEFGIIEPSHDQEGFISNIFTRPKKDGGYRMILDLSELNLNITYHHFKMDTLETAIKLIFRGCYMTSIDLKDAYYSVPISEKHRKYLRFSWGNQIWRFTALPNGLSSGPRLFTKLLKPPLSHLRKLGITVLAYIDDTLMVSKSLPEAEIATRKVAETFSDLGFIIHPKKSVVKPSQEIQFLGFILDSAKMQVRLTDEKKNEIKELCATLLSKECHSIRVVATALGKFVAAFPGVENGKLHYRELERAKIHALKKHHGHFDRTMNLSLKAKDDIRWWSQNIYDSWRVIRPDYYELTITTDASGLGWGATNGVDEIGKRWNFLEQIRAQNNEINYLEMLAAFLALQAFCSNTNDTAILLRLDNTTAVTYINNMGGIKSIACNQMAKTIWDWCSKRRIWLHAVYLPGKNNVTADKMSRKFNDHLEWMLNPKIFSQICSTLGTPDIDLFASRLNAQLKRYIAWKPDPGAEACDAFTIEWKNEFVYAFPPFTLILRCLQKIQHERAEGIFVVPNWPTQPWFPLILKLLSEDPILLPHSKTLLWHPGVEQFHPLHNNLSLLVCRLSGNPINTQSYQRKHQISSWHPGDPLPKNNTTFTCRNGWHFLANNKLILSTPQSLMS